MTLDEYLRLLDWMGRQLRRDKVGRIPEEFAPLLDRRDCSAESWLDLVKNFCKKVSDGGRTSGHIAKREFNSRACRHANSSACLPLNLLTRRSNR